MKHLSATVQSGRGLVTVVLCGAVLSGCGDLLGPDSGRDSVVLLHDLSSHLLVIDPRTGAVLAEPGPVGKAHYMDWSVTASPAGDVLYLATIGFEGAPEFSAVDLGGLRVLWRRPLEDLPGLEGFRVSHDRVGGTGEQLLVQLLDDHGFSWLGALDLTTWEWVAQVGPLTSSPASDGWIEEHFYVPPGPVGAAGGVVVLAVSQAPPGQSAVSDDYRVILVDPVEWEADTLQVIPSADAAMDRASSILPAPDGRHLYVLTVGGWLHRYDLVTRQRVASVELPFRGSDLVCSSTDDRLYLRGRATREAAPPPIILRYTSDLTPLEPIDLSEEDPVLGPMTISRDGETLFVGAGETSYGPVYYDPPPRLLVLDVRSGDLLRELPHKGVEAKALFVR